MNHVSYCNIRPLLELDAMRKRFKKNILGLNKDSSQYVPFHVDSDPSFLKETADKIIEYETNQENRKELKLKKYAYGINITDAF